MRVETIVAIVPQHEHTACGYKLQKPTEKINTQTQSRDYKTTGVKCYPKQEMC